MRGIPNKSSGHSAEGSQRNVPLASCLETKTTAQGMKEIQTSSLASATVDNSYYADKDLSWWLQLARDFKQAKLIPLADDRDGGLWEDRNWRIEMLLRSLGDWDSFGKLDIVASRDFTYSVKSICFHCLIVCGIVYLSSKYSTFDYSWFWILYERSEHYQVEYWQENAIVFAWDFNTLASFPWITILELFTFKFLPKVGLWRRVYL
jgi:hypothetical protein